MAREGGLLACLDCGEIRRVLHAKVDWMLSAVALALAGLVRNGSTKLSKGKF